MRAKAKSSSTPYPIWVEGEYITEPPIRPSDGAVRPAGHYIDKGGYPGANVYEVDINTMCRQTDAADRFGKPIYEQDILLYETAEEIGYFIVQDLETTVDIVNGEIIEVGDLDTENIKNIGSMVDYTYQSRQKTTGSRRIYLPLELIQVNPFCCRGYRLRKRAPDTAISRKTKTNISEDMTRIILKVLRQRNRY